MTFMSAQKATGSMAPGQVSYPLPDDTPGLVTGASHSQKEVTLKDVIRNSMAIGPTYKSESPVDTTVRPDPRPPWDVWWYSRPLGRIPLHIQSAMMDELRVGEKR